MFDLLYSVAAIPPVFICLDASFCLYQPLCTSQGVILLFSNFLSRAHEPRLSCFHLFFRLFGFHHFRLQLATPPSTTSVAFAGVNNLGNISWLATGATSASSSYHHHHHHHFTARIRNVGFPFALWSVHLGNGKAPYLYGSCFIFLFSFFIFGAGCFA